MPASRKPQYSSCTMVMQEPMRSMSALINVMASAFSSASESMRTVLSKIMVMRLPR